eukprot:Colp12_sorted_trinity150504_noHs@13539
MGNGMNKILDGLYLGNISDSQDPKQLEANGITHILSVHETADTCFDHIKYKLILAADHPTQNLSQYFSEAIDFIHDCRMSGGSCLVHCMAGVSRSTTLVAAYVMTVTELEHREALKLMASLRRCICPNIGFMYQLETFDKEGVAKERQKLTAKDPNLDTKKEQDNLKQLANEANEKQAGATGPAGRRFSNN